MIPTLSEVCCLNSSFDRDLEDFAAGGFQNVEVWLTKLETYLQTHSLNEVRYWLEKTRLTLAVASYQGGLLASQGEARHEAWALLDRRLALCRELAIPTIVVACDVPGPLVNETIQRVQVSLVQLARESEKHSVRVAMEFQTTGAFGNNLETAAALVSDVASPHLGICLDAFHWHTGPSKNEDLALLTTDNLFHVQLCDLSGVPRELARDSDRILPGDGDIPLDPIIGHLKKIDYRGCVSIELMNPTLRQVPPLQLADASLAALRRLGLAATGENAQ
jgi:2-keto-myo-inositol isomerase